MRETRKTLVFAAVAGVLALAAVLLTPRHRPAAAFSDQGQAFYPAFTDPLAATSLEIVEYDEEAARLHTFKVELRNGKWSIPSHHDYPADAKDRLAKTATSVIDLRRDTIRSDRPQDHEAFGVIDPVDEKATKGRGKHVIFRDAAGQVLADFIFGKETKDGSGMRYIRLPGQKRTYGVKTRGEITGRFEDWIETDLLKLSSASIRRIVIDNYSIDTEKGIQDRAVYYLDRDNATAPWKLGEMTEKEEINTATVDDMIAGIDALKIVGVRRKPSGFSSGPDGQIRLDREAYISLLEKGYFVVNGDLLSKQGETRVECEDGIVYTLRFGEVIYGAGDELTAGTETTKADPKKGGSENRYLFVTANFDPSMLPPEPVAPVAVKPDPSRTPDQQKAEEERFKKENAEYELKKKEHADKIAAGKKRAQELSQRFADWYYVISADCFRKLRRNRADLVRPKELPKTPEPPRAPEPPK